jgi:hypothetical protein
VASDVGVMLRNDVGEHKELQTETQTLCSLLHEHREAPQRRF